MQDADRIESDGVTSDSKFVDIYLFAYLFLTFFYYLFI